MEQEKMNEINMYEKNEVKNYFVDNDVIEMELSEIKKDSLIDEESKNYPLKMDLNEIKNDDLINKRPEDSYLETDFYNNLIVKDTLIDGGDREFCSKRVKDFFLEQFAINESVIRYFVLKGLIFDEGNQIMQVSYDKTVNKYYDFQRECFEPINENTLSLLLVGINTKVIYVFRTLIEAMSYLSIMDIKRGNFKDYTILILYENKIFDYYMKHICSIKHVYVVGELGRNLLLEKLEKSKKGCKITYLTTVENSVNDDLKFVKRLGNKKGI